VPDVTAKSLDTDDLSWISQDGSQRTAVKLQTVYIGRGTYLPGWRWSKHARNPQTTSEAHVGYIISGQMRMKGADGTEVQVGPGEAFEVTPGHDAWVVGTDPCVALDFGVL
jgi:hypothetical protein